MNSYFIANVSDAKRRLLGDAGIPYYEHVLLGEHRVSGGEDLAGILIQDPNLELSMRTIGMDVVKTTETTMVGIYHLEVRDTAAPAVVAVAGATAVPAEVAVEVKDTSLTVHFDALNYPFNGKKPASYEAVVKEVFSGFLKGEIKIFCPHKYAAPPRLGGVFNIYLWSSPSGAPAAPPPEKMFGIPVSCRDYVFRPSRTGEPIADEAGYVVAELLDDINLYIHHDVVEYGDDNELAIFKRTLEEAKKIIASDPSARLERRKQIERELTETYRDAYIKNSMERYQVRKKQAEDQVKVLDNRLKELQADLVTTIRSLQDNRDILAAENPKAEDQKKVLSLEFDKLVAIDKIRRVVVDKNNLSVYTTNLYCEDPRSKKLHDIGEFRIDISFIPNRGRDAILWTNLTRKIHAADRDMYAPHVQGNGVACLGNLAEMIPPLLAQYQFSALAMIAIQFIESVNVNDGWGAHINKWPIVDKAAVTKEGQNVEVVEQA